MKEQLIKNIKIRLGRDISPHNPLKLLKLHDPEKYIDDVIAIVYLYTRAKRGVNKTIYLSEVISAIGHKVRSRLKLKRDSATAAKIGAFFLYSFEYMGAIEVVLGQGKKGHAAYVVHILDDDLIVHLWRKLDPSSIEKLPSTKPYLPWREVRHDTGQMMIKTGNADVLKSISLESHPILFDCLNKAQKVGWMVNKRVYGLEKWALASKAKAFNDIWEQQNPEAKQTKMREAKAILEIAERFVDKTFYHLYYYDFRGRKYAATAYLHEQGSDPAKGMLLREDKKPITEAGFIWLMISIASNWAGDAGREDKAKTDKIPLEERYFWAVDNEELLLSYAKSPRVNKGWMDADKPWQFIAACFELERFRTWQLFMEGTPDYNEYGYESHLECYIDGSNNGSQHLAALTRDEITAPHVNLTPSVLPGDLYKYVADNVWRRLDTMLSKMSETEKAACNWVVDTLIDLKKQISIAEPRSEFRSDLVDQIKAFKEENEDLFASCAVIYWCRITDIKERRKIVKRNVMTLPYGGTAYGLGQQVIDDSKKHGIEMLLYLEHKWGAFMGRLVYEDHKVSMQRPMRLLSIFEEAGREAEKRGEFLNWIVPVTHFPVVQNYTQGTKKKVWIQYGPPQGERLNTGYYRNTLQVFICFLEEPIPQKRKQSQGASPNAIHSLDAAHLALTVHRADFGLTTVHDSFGSLLADMPELFCLIRETFVELYSHDPLTAIMQDIGGDISHIELGSLSIEDVLDSDYAFA